MQKEARSSPPDYVINVGDNFYWGGIDVKCGAPAYGCQDSTGQWEGIFESIYHGQGLDGKPWLGVLGNHDYGGYMFTSGWDQVVAYTWATRRPSTGRWVTPAQYWSLRIHYPGFSVEYFFTDSNVHVASAPKGDQAHNLCSFQHNTPKANCGPEGPTSVQDCPQWFQRLWSKQQRWLEMRLSNSTADWQVAVTHFPPHYGQDEWKKLAEAYGIDLIITGHWHKQEVHNMEETNMLRPTAWIVSGGGGGITSEGIPDKHGADDQYGFMDLTFSKTAIRIKAISHGGMVRSTTLVHPRAAAKPHARPTAEASQARAGAAPPAAQKFV